MMAVPTKPTAPQTESGVAPNTPAAESKPTKRYRWPFFTLGVAMAIAVLIGVCTYQIPAAVQFTLEGAFSGSLRWLTGLVVFAIFLIVPALLALVGLVRGRRRLISLISLIVCVVGAPIALYAGAHMGVGALQDHALAFAGQTYDNMGGASGIIQYAFGQAGLTVPGWLDTILSLAGV